MVTNTKEFSDLFGLSSKGKIKYWKIMAIEFDNSRAKISVTHGYVDHPDSFQTNEKEIFSKNTGKKNQTTPYEQACMEAQSTWNKKIDEQYKLTKEELINPDQEELELPMLAHEYTKRGKDIVYPCYVQPKLNGVRCLIKQLPDRLRATSRGGKEYKAITHIFEQIVTHLEHSKLMDGELYNHNLTFQQIVTAIKNETDLDENLPLIQYWVYDLPSDADFSDRYNALSALVNQIQGASIVLVETHLVQNEAELAYYHAKFTNEGFEGTMIRNIKGGYKFKHRSTDLQKYKDFVAAEFRIVGGEEGVGLAEGQCVFTCETESGQRFNVRCVGTNAVREEQWQNLPNYINKMLTVKFQNYSDTGVPIFPVGVAIRDGAFVDGQFQPDM